jgi:hypothetical protein
MTTSALPNSATAETVVAPRGAVSFRSGRSDRQMTDFADRVLIEILVTSLTTSGC